MHIDALNEENMQPRVERNMIKKTILINKQFLIFMNNKSIRMGMLGEMVLKVGIWLF